MTVPGGGDYKQKFIFTLLLLSDVIDILRIGSHLIAFVSQLEHTFEIA